MPKNKQWNLIASVKMPNIDFINKYIINSGIRGGGGGGGGPVADPENFGRGDLKHKTSKIRMSSPKLRVIFRPKSEIQTFFSPKFRWSPKNQKKKKRSSPKLRVIFRPKSDIQTFFSPKFRWSPKRKKQKQKVFTKIETDFSPDSLRLGRWGGCIPPSPP